MSASEGRPQGALVLELGCGPTEPEAVPAVDGTASWRAVDPSRAHYPALREHIGRTRRIVVSCFEEGRTPELVAWLNRSRIEAPEAAQVVAVAPISAEAELRVHRRTRNRADLYLLTARSLTPAETIRRLGEAQSSLPGGSEPWTEGTLADGTRVWAWTEPRRTRFLDPAGWLDLLEVGFTVDALIFLIRWLACA